MLKLYYQSRKSSGRAWLLGPGDHDAEVFSQFIDFDKLMEIENMIYLNAFNLIGNDFKNIYHQGCFPGENYLDEWGFIPLAQE
jgi:hypothetical protein